MNAGLTKTEQVALHLWTQDTGKVAWFQQINRALRSGNAGDLQRLQPLIAAMRSGLEKLPPFVGTVYRAIKEKPFTAGEFSKYIESHQSGLEVIDAGFSGASQVLEQALRGRVKMSIESINGKNISALSSKPEQQEILFTLDSRFLVTDRFDQTNKVIRLWLQQLPQ